MWYQHQAYKNKAVRKLVEQVTRDNHNEVSCNLYCGVDSDDDLIKAVKDNNNPEKITALLGTIDSLHKLYQCDSNGNTVFHYALNGEVFTALMRACSRLYARARSDNVLIILPFVLANNKGETFIDKALNDCTGEKVKPILDIFVTWLENEDIISKPSNNNLDQAEHDYTSIALDFSPLCVASRLQVFSLFIGAQWDLAKQFFSKRGRKEERAVTDFFVVSNKFILDAKTIKQPNEKVQSKENKQSFINNRFILSEHIIEQKNDLNEKRYSKQLPLLNRCLAYYKENAKKNVNNVYIELFDIFLHRLFSGLPCSNEQFNFFAVHLKNNKNQRNIFQEFLFLNRSAQSAFRAHITLGFNDLFFEENYHTFSLKMAQLIGRITQSEDPFTVLADQGIIRLGFIFWSICSGRTIDIVEKLPGPYKAYCAPVVIVISDLFKLDQEFASQSKKVLTHFKEQYFGNLSPEAFYFFAASGSTDLVFDYVREHLQGNSLNWFVDSDDYKPIASPEDTKYNSLYEKWKTTPLHLALEAQHFLVALHLASYDIWFGDGWTLTIRDYLGRLPYHWVEKYKAYWITRGGEVDFSKQGKQKGLSSLNSMNGYQILKELLKPKTFGKVAHIHKWPTCKSLTRTGRTPEKIKNFEKKVNSSELIDARELVEFIPRDEDEKYQTLESLEKFIQLCIAQDKQSQLHTLLLKGPHGSCFRLVAKTIASRLEGVYKEPPPKIQNKQGAEVNNFLDEKVVSGKIGFKGMFHEVKQVDSDYEESDDNQKPISIFYLGSLEDFVYSDKPIEDSLLQARNQLLLELVDLKPDHTVILVGSIPDTIKLDPRLRRCFRYCFPLGYPNLHGRQRLIDRLLQMRAPELPVSAEIIKRVSKATQECTRRDFTYFVDKLKPQYSLDESEKDSVYKARSSLKEMLLYLQRDTVEECLKVFDNRDKAITFDRIAGKSDKDKDIQKIAAEFKVVTGDKREFLPHFIIMHGPPGTGKTLRAQAFANETGYSFTEISASVFSRPHLGEGAIEVRKIFKQAAENKPTVLFIDEIDAVAAWSDNNERINTITELFKQIDHFKENDCGVILAATNRFEELDDRVTDRANEIIEIPLPNQDGCREIFTFMMNQIEEKYLFPFPFVRRRFSDIASQMHYYGFSVRNIKDAINQSVRPYVIDNVQITYTDFKKQIKRIAQSKWHKEADLMCFRFVEAAVDKIVDEELRARLKDDLLRKKQTLKRLVKKRQQQKDVNICKLHEAERCINLAFSKPDQVTVDSLQKAFGKYRE